MYKTEISEVKKKLQKGRWWLDKVAETADLNKAETKLESASYELESATQAVLELCKLVDGELHKNEISDILNDCENGSITLGADNLLHIRLNMSLPNTKSSVGIKEITKTIHHLLDSHKDYYGELPFYENVFVAIIEHRNPQSGGSFDHDNKGFRAIPNALKGRVFGDDNQFEMSLGLFTRENYGENYTDIYVVPMSDLAYFSSSYLVF